MKDDGTVWPALKPRITQDGRRLVDGDEYLRSAMAQSERDAARDLVRRLYGESEHEARVAVFDDAEAKLREWGMA
jgi:hypothetical protein